MLIMPWVRNALGPQAPTAQNPCRGLHALFLSRTVIKHSRQALVFIRGAMELGGTKAPPGRDIALEVSIMKAAGKAADLRSEGPRQLLEAGARCRLRQEVVPASLPDRRPVQVRVFTLITCRPADVLNDVPRITRAKRLLKGREQA